VKARSMLNKANRVDLESTLTVSESLSATGAEVSAMATQVRDLVKGVLDRAGNADTAANATASVTAATPTTALRISDGAVPVPGDPSKLLADLAASMLNLSTKLDDHVRQYDADKRDDIRNGARVSGAVPDGTSPDGTTPNGASGAGTNTTTKTNDSPPSPTKMVVSVSQASRLLRRQTV